MKRDHAADDATPSGRSYHHGDLRRALLDAALPLVQTHGVQGFTLRDAARAAGVSHNAPYRHFASREQLLVALALHGQETLLELLQSRLATASSPRARLDRLGASYLEFAHTHESLFRVMFSSEVYRNRSAELAATQDRTFQFFRTELHRAEASGLIRPGHADRGAFAGWSALHGAALLILDGVLRDASFTGRLEPKQLAKLLIDTLLAGLLPAATIARRGRSQ